MGPAQLKLRSITDEIVLRAREDLGDFYNLWGLFSDL